MFSVSFGEYEANCQADGMPDPEALADFAPPRTDNVRNGREWLLARSVGRQRRRVPAG